MNSAQQGGGINVTGGVVVALAGLLFSVQCAILGAAVSIEHRLTKLETYVIKGTDMNGKALAATAIGMSFAASAYQDSAGRLAGSTPAPSLAVHEFVGTDDGLLVHYIDGTLRATVPPEGQADYCEHWPDAAPIVKVLMGADKLTIDTAPATSKRKPKA
jgi:hypothetical protein